jgi:hypothetical protein
MKGLDLPVVRINAAAAPAVGDRSMRLRDELWFNVRAWLAKRHCKLCEDEPLIAELTTPRYKSAQTYNIPDIDRRLSVTIAEGAIAMPPLSSPQVRV